MKHSFSISEALSFGWNTFKKNWKFWVIAMIFATAVGGGMGGYSGSSSKSSDSYNQKQTIRDTKDELTLGQYIQNDSAATEILQNVENNESLNWAFIGALMLLSFPYVIVAFLFAMFSAVVLNCMSMGFNKLCLDAVRGNDLKYETLLSIVDLKKSVKYLGAMFLYLLIIMIGFVLFIVPGIYWAIKYSMFYFAIVDKNLGIFDSFRYSSKLTKGVKWKLFAFGLLNVILLICGAIALFVGAFAVAIVIYLASAYIYETLRKQLEEENIPAEAVQVGIN